MTGVYYEGINKQIREVILTERDFVAKGGEKAIYVKGSSAYCVYHPGHSPMPVAKISELLAINNYRVICPSHALFDSAKKHVGEVMPFVSDAFVLCQLFGGKFCRSHGITDKHRERVSSAMINVMHSCHAAAVLMVDPNERNWLVSEQDMDVYAIDSSAWKTPSYPATAIKPSIRDYQSNVLTEGTDWYSLAVVIMHLWLGMHPYTTGHPDYSQGAGDMVKRMRDMVSCFDARTELHANCRDMSKIPAKLYTWLERLLSSSAREPAPTTMGKQAAKVVKTKQTRASGGFQLEQLEVLVQEPVNRQGGEWLYAPFQWGMRTAVTSQFVLGSLDNGSLSLRVGGQTLPTTHHATAAFEANGQLYVLYGSQISAVICNERLSPMRSTLQFVSTVSDNPRQVKVYEGVVIQSLPSMYFATLLPRFGETYTRKLPELDSHQVLSAKSQGSVLVLHTSRAGKYYQHVYIWGDGFKNHAYYQEELAAYREVSFAIANGKFLLVAGDRGRVVIRQLSVERDVSRVVMDARVTEDSELYTREDSAVLLSLGREIYRVRLA